MVCLRTVMATSSPKLVTCSGSGWLVAGAPAAAEEVHPTRWHLVTADVAVVCAVVVPGWHLVTAQPIGSVTYVVWILSRDLVRLAWWPPCTLHKRSLHRHTHNQGSLDAKAAVASRPQRGWNMGATWDRAGTG
jgi:hypothetical protein